ncbi:bifunctional UDP-N-acetylglucosamine diphosphorylase/glucosamine-1-phosphate N-acetyltransferase GlmU, partial [Campylobacter upsaliensis]|nr:bifunctional UDP-N-acetylglucosamine diphosphorylase/glucosamine-1-phosphate N-acetyltransferase GlmU [Campylobacter upsaliensis]
FIGLDVKFIGECELYENVRIEGKSVIESSIIKSSSVIEDSKISFSSIGPLAHLRPKCELKNTHIGNFVECKNAKLNGVKAGHLSYLGDCEIEEGTNIGCGTITCNYDGVKKHKTIIGKNVFVGSDTQFIAPVCIEDEVIIAAGSSVSENVPKGSLFINRAQSKILKDYFYKKFQ